MRVIVDGFDFLDLVGEICISPRLGIDRK